MLKQISKCVVQRPFCTKRMITIKRGPFTETPDKSQYTWIGPPHPISNLRPTIFPKRKDLTEAEKSYHSVYLQTQAWNQQYWEKHNSEFQKAKETYVENYEKQMKSFDCKNSPLNAEEMACFYKSFLDENHKKHINYNWEWYRRHFHLLYLALLANLSRIVLYFPLKKTR